MKKLPESELKVMMIIWDNIPPVSRQTVSQALESQGWANTTILTLLSRLVKKGFLSCEKKGNKNMYTALISKDEYMHTESRSYIDKLRNTSLTSFVAAFVESRGITDSEIDRLEEMIARYRRKNTK